MNYRDGYFMCPNHRTIAYGQDGRWVLVRRMCFGTGTCSIEDTITRMYGEFMDLDMGRYAMNLIASTKEELTMYLLAE